MLKIFSLKLNKSKDGLRVSKETDKVYEFFTSSKPSVRKRAYGTGLRMAQKDQADILKKAAALKI